MFNIVNDLHLRLSGDSDTSRSFCFPKKRNHCVADTNPEVNIREFKQVEIQKLLGLVQSSALLEDFAIIYPTCVLPELLNFLSYTPLDSVGQIKRCCVHYIHLLH